MLKILLSFVISLYIGLNLLVYFRYSTKEMWRCLVKEQNKVCRIISNLFYLPTWVLKLITILVIKSCKKLWRGIKYCYYTIARFIQQIYHSIFDLI